MNSSTKLKVAALILILAITLFIKAAGLVVDRPAGEKLAEKLVSLLERAGFSVQQRNLLSGSEFIGSAGDCRVAVREAIAQGYNLESIASWVPKDMKLSFVFRGEFYDYPPTYRATAAFVLTRALRQFGINTAWQPMVAVAATSACDLKMIAWDELVVR